ncbi:heme-binding domain-containing protein [Riemerella columbina]|uniref:heme-binding domain-containing protein n=1 Tax=Riemerella columbina TaxID=103810 RepID=UPI00037CDE33|nr:heme-binding domain-containing protein [Riemerella columbina]
MNKTLKVILWIILGLGLIQLIPVDRTNPPVEAKTDFVKIEHAPEKVTQLLKTACYDCHSYETRYPNYAYIAPLSWSIKSHINDGRRYLNFSVWETYNPYLKQGAIEHTIETIKNGSMPLPSYINFHPEAQLTPKEKQLLIDFFQKKLDSLTQK